SNIILKLELQIVSLSQGNYSEPKQERSISQLESEIKEINQELGIKKTPKEKKPNNPENPKSPTKNPESPKEKDEDLPNKDTPPNDRKKYQHLTNEQFFENKKDCTQSLNELLDRMNKQYKEVFDTYNSAPKESRDIVDALLNGKAKNFIESCQTKFDINKKNKTELGKYFSDSDYQIFLSASKETQKANLELIESIFSSVLSNTKSFILADINYFKEMVKFGEELFVEMSKLGTTPDLEEKAKQELQVQKDILINCESRLNKDNGGFELGVMKQI
ncbi:13959_t:CDS:1, partial [Funneliformis geosporum]